MALPIVRIKLVAALTALLLSVHCVAQGYEVSGGSSLSGTFTLTVFDGDSTSHSYTAKANKGRFFFSGEVAKPTLASIEHAAMPRPLFFYLENASVSINLNASRPEASLIRGSRSNSEYRYLMERYNASADPNAFLRQCVQENSSSVFIPFILFNQMASLDETVVRQLVGKLTGDAQKVYHYTMLRRWMRQTPAVSEGCEMPDFAWLDSRKSRHTFAEMRDTSQYTLIFFTAGWCDICASQRTQAFSLLEDKAADILTINIDDNPNGWDAHYLQQLSVNHIPYLIMVDPEGLVTARDIRSWELYKLRSKK